MLPFADALIDHPQLKERIFALRETAQAFAKANSSFNLPAQAMRDISQTLEIFLSVRQARRDAKALKDKKKDEKKAKAAEVKGKSKKVRIISRTLLYLVLTFS
jgi:hypothetical protein